MKSIFVILLLFISSDLLACSCGTLPKIDKQAIANSKYIFIGKVIIIEPNDNRSRKITFQISERLKTDSTNVISVFTDLGGADCGLDLKEGQEWYIFIYDDNNEKSWAGLCGRSALLSQHSIPPNPYSKKYYRQAIKQYNRDKTRAKKEIKFISKTVL